MKSIKLHQTSDRRLGRPARSPRSADLSDGFVLLEDIEKACILTHCNTGSLATGGYGTALGVIRSL
ncbi:S-methyl-5-thioribose-1-phosphate isomerase, partial [Brachionus plicatilis]